MKFGSTDSAAADIGGGGGGVQGPQRRCGKEAATKSDGVRLDLKGDMEAGGLEESTTEVRERYHKGGT